MSAAEVASDVNRVRQGRLDIVKRLLHRLVKRTTVYKAVLGVPSAQLFDGRFELSERRLKLTLTSDSCASAMQIATAIANISCYDSFTAFEGT